MAREMKTPREGSAQQGDGTRAQQEQQQQQSQAGSGQQQAGTPAPKFRDWASI